MGDKVIEKSGDREWTLRRDLKRGDEYADFRWFGGLCGVTGNRKEWTYISIINNCDAINTCIATSTCSCHGDWWWGGLDQHWLQE